MLVIGAAVERESQQDTKPSFSEGVEGFNFLGKDWPRLAHSSYFYAIIAYSNWGWERFQLQKLSCPCCLRKQTTHTKVSLFWPWLAKIKNKNSNFARSVWAAANSQVAPSADFPGRYFIKVQTISQRLLINPNITRGFAVIVHSKPDTKATLYTSLHITIVYRLYG